MPKTRTELAIDYAQDKLGDHFDDVLNVATNIKDGRAPLTFDPQYLESYGGADEILTVIENTVTAGDWRRAQELKNEVVGLWDKAAGEENPMSQGGGLAALFSQNVSATKRAEMMRDSLSAMQGGQNNQAIEDMQRIRQLDREIREADNDYRREQLESEKQKLTEKTNRSIMDPQIESAKKQDAKSVSALIVVLGAECLPNPDIHTDIVNPS